jgi:hypothetical protein
MPVAWMVAAGTSAGDVWEVDADPKILLHGQQGGEMLSVATNPHYPHVFAALSAAGHVGIWNAITHKVGDMTSMAKVGIIHNVQYCLLLMLMLMFSRPLPAGTGPTA